MKVVCISDTHEQHRNLEIPEGDLLIHSGDITFSGEAHVVKDFMEWFKDQPHKHKIFIAGNHDDFFETRSVNHGIELRDSGISIEGLNVWGSPMTPTFGVWAFMANRGLAIKAYWDKIPPDTDILITHGPPFGIQDLTPPRWGSRNAGCEELLKAVQRIKPKLHVFGHIHHGYGVTTKDGTIFVNASTCTEEYKATNKPIVVTI